MRSTHKSCYRKMTLEYVFKEYLSMLRLSAVFNDVVICYYIAKYMNDKYFLKILAFFRIQRVKVPKVNSLNLM